VTIASVCDESHTEWRSNAVVFDSSMAGTGTHRILAKNGESGFDTWMNKWLVKMRTLVRYSSIASHGRYGLNRDRRENNTLGGDQRMGTAWPEPPGCPQGSALPGRALVQNRKRRGWWHRGWVPRPSRRARIAYDSQMPVRLDTDTSALGDEVRG